MACMSCSSFSSPKYYHITPQTILHHKLQRATLSFNSSLTTTTFRHPFQLQAKSTDTNLDAKATDTDDATIPSSELSQISSDSAAEDNELVQLLGEVWAWGLLISPFFFWGTAIVAMKEILPKAGPFFVASFRLIPAGFLVVAFAAFKGRKLPSGFNAWLSIILFALVDATFFQAI